MIFGYKDLKLFNTIVVYIFLSSFNSKKDGSKNNAKTV
ncbi:hypothetical protein AsAng_0060220 [Aureispira anguillae]|uniref:Uncharacterized protein n=1 Tax=Aureispira anguillae TaxID=2864201 RepID=A0A915YL62_9BACT|nr:hypothetical protein AsAng_0060220 [Aureispira anguillae]